ncbi:uncharacterized protein LOC131071604 isoform X1 [Cryptomeria japonica]|uniref:uncharacterized protein LOC131071604 isoform X1 n=1 Tax=Cryptomeria japonica TaxID=3369 RepID=UPI0027D9ED30|nr:uncharacterized protein LOC131071604 isoform X1 [Cryptomeria japonica]
MGESQISIGKANVRLCASQWKKTHRSRGSCKSRRNENLQSAVGRKIWLGRDLPIESNIWRDRMHYGFKLHSCRLGFSFANDRLPLEHGQGAIRVSILPLLHSTGYVSQSCFCPSTISENMRLSCLMNGGQFLSEFRSSKSRKEAIRNLRHLQLKMLNKIALKVFIVYLILPNQNNYGCRVYESKLPYERTLCPAKYFLSRSLNAEAQKNHKNTIRKPKKPTKKFRPARKVYKEIE